MKANCRLFLIDDFGASAGISRDLADRWMGLTEDPQMVLVGTGLPCLRQLIIFSRTWTPPASWTRRSLRRIRYKIGFESDDQVRESPTDLRAGCPTFRQFGSFWTALRPAPESRRGATIRTRPPGPGHRRRRYMEVPRYALSGLLEAACNNCFVRPLTRREVKRE